MSDANANTPNTELAPVDRIAAILDSTQNDNPELQDDEVQATTPDVENEEAEEVDPSDPQGEPLEEFDIDGTKYKLPAAVKPHLLRQQDYTRKTQELAEQRRAVEQERAVIPQLRDSYAQRLQIAEQFIARSLPQPPPEHLLDEGPEGVAEYNRQHARYVNEARKLQAVMAEQQTIHWQMHQEAEHRRQQEQAVQYARLPEVIPEWKDQKVREKESAELWHYLVGLGRNPEELKNALNADDFAIARKAWLWDKMQQGKQAARPVAQRTAPPSAARTQQTSQTDRKAFDRLQRTGRRQDAVGLVAKFLPKE